jgi:hypothetical protein
MPLDEGGFEAAHRDEARRIERARARSVMIATPIARAPCWQYTMAFAETCVLFEQLGMRYTCRFIVGSSNLPRARNEIAARFLASGFDDLVLVDDDMGWGANSVVRLIASPQPVIGGVGRKRVDKPQTDPDTWCARFLDGAERGLEQDAMGAVRVARVGTGFLKVSREVFERLIAAHPEWKRPGRADMPDDVRAHYYQFFRFDDGDELGEDYVFCERWRAVGGDIWIDPSIALMHVGEKEYAGRIGDIMEEAE